MLDQLGSFAISALGSAAPLALAALGGLATEAAGSLSIALEGYMLVGAFAAAACGQAAGSLGLGFAAGASGIGCRVPLRHRHAGPAASPSRDSASGETHACHQGGSGGLLAGCAESCDCDGGCAGRGIHREARFQ